MIDETPDTPEEPTPDAVTEEPAAEAAPEESAPAADEAPAEPAEPVALLTPKERKVAARARRGKRRGATPEERTELRKQKAAARSRRRKQEREKARANRSDTPAAPTPPAEHGEGRPKVRQGVVVSAKADKTITVRIDDARRHRRYEKIVRSSMTLHAHDEKNDAGAGDTVRVIESRPLSRTKRWRLVEILERAK